MKSDIKAKHSHNAIVDQICKKNNQSKSDILSFIAYL